MRKIFTIATALFLGATGVNGQTVANFDTLSLSGTDTFYVNYSKPGKDVGFDDGLAHFQTLYDTAGYKSLRRGFVYSNMTDSVTSGYKNPNSAKAAQGYKGSKQYLAAYASLGSTYVTLKGKAKGQPVNGFYVTNNTYAYNSMRDGDGFAKKFGGVPNNDSDWFMITIKGYLNGTANSDSVNFYLADFRNPDSTKDYILKTWEWVDLSTLGKVDSLTFSLNSSDTGAFGMNTPAYFCMDNFETFETSSVSRLANVLAAKVYPNPARDVLYIETEHAGEKNILVSDISGKVVKSIKSSEKVTLVNTSSLNTGIYVIKIADANGVASTRFIKQ